MAREKIKTPNFEAEINGIYTEGPLLLINFGVVVDLTNADLSSIEVFTGGGECCARLQGYTTIYRSDGISVILSNDGSVYTEPVPVEPIPVVPYVPTEAQFALQEIEKLKAELESTDYQVIKCSEYQLTGNAVPYDVAALHLERQTLRNRINELELKLV